MLNTYRVTRFGRGLIAWLLLTGLPGWAQTEPANSVIINRLAAAEPRRSVIYFPQAPRPGRWRKAIGAVFTTTPPELTEEIRVQVPAIDFTLQRGLSKQWYVVGRLQSQLVQNHLSLGVRWATPLNDRFYVSVGNDVSGWGGALRIENVFNSQAYGLQTYPNASLGYQLSRNLRLTLKSEMIVDFYSRLQVGTLATVRDRNQLNGVAFAVVLEQPFYHNQSVLLGFRAAYSNFNWQFWSLYDTFDRHIFYPQLVFGFIL